MLRKTLFGIILSILTISSWAMGFYIGAGGGVETADFNQSATIIQPRNFFAIDKTHLSGEGIFGSIFGGYGWNYDKFYLAGEVNANLSSVAFNASNQEILHQSFSHTKYSVDHNFGVSLLPGFLFTNNTLFYGRLGYSLGNFQIDTTDTSLANIDKNLNGLRYGLGVRQTIYKQLSVILDYSRIEYQSATIFTLDPLSFTSKKTTISPAINQFQLGLVYNFC